MSECPCCGSTEDDRARYKADALSPEQLTTELLRCQYCEGQKCCMCDMGDDVACGNCFSEDGE